MDVRSRTAVPALRRSGRSVSRLLPVIDTLVAELRPDQPLYGIRPAVLRATASGFIQRFPGDVLYAVKCNPEPTVLRALWDGGVRHFDCASIGEIRLIRQLFPSASIYFMHPIKPAAAIREAYERWDVRDFSLDHETELDKIVAVTGGIDLGLHIRLALPKGAARFDLSGKFGARPFEAASLLRRARGLAARLGICFHVGSQCMAPSAYADAIKLAAAITVDAGVSIDVLDVGGGFPVDYPDMTPPALDAYFVAIEDAVAGFGEVRPHVWCEPGRAMVATGASVVAKVEARRGLILHINDGVFGNLADAGVPGLRYPVRIIRPANLAAPSNDMAAFSFYGPTCDSADYMAGPFMLPADIDAGDWIELGQLGAYGPCLRTSFNGFDRTLFAQVSDPAMIVVPELPVSQLMLNAA